MADFDWGKLAPEVARILMSRGAQAPPLDWAEEPNPTAKRKLDIYEDGKLFDGVGIKDEIWAPAVRALMYLWTGWVNDALMHAEIIAGKEKLYICAICERQAGHADVAKKLLQQLQGHEVFAALAGHVQAITKNEKEGAIARFRDTVEQYGEWEPFLFADLCEQARANRLAAGGVELVRLLQVREFDLLFNHCYHGLTDQNVLKFRRKLSEDEERQREQEYRKRMADRRAARDKRVARDPCPAKTDKAKDKTRDKNDANKPGVGVKIQPAKPDPRVKVQCPACGHLMFAPQSLRGKGIKCLKCKVLFKVPEKKEPAATASPPPSA